MEYQIETAISQNRVSQTIHHLNKSPAALLILILKPCWKGRGEVTAQTNMKGVRCWRRGRHRQKALGQLEKTLRLKTSRVWPEEPHRCLVSPESRNSNRNQPGFPSWEDSIDLQPGWVTEAITHQAHESDVTCGVGTARWRTSHHANPCSSGHLSFSVPCHPWSLYLRFLLPLAEFSSFRLPYNPSHFFKLSLCSYQLANSCMEQQNSSARLFSTT